jgi:hypothetical protein
MLLEQLEELSGKLRSEEQVEPAALEEQTVRLLAGMVTLLKQHNVNKRGQCQYCCGRTWRWWRRRPQCTVYVSLDFAIRQPLDMVRRLLEDHTR